MKMYYVDKRPYLYWSHKTITNAIRADTCPAKVDSQLCHTDLANCVPPGIPDGEGAKGLPTGRVQVEAKGGLVGHAARNRRALVPPHVQWSVQ
ncbi:hypothetical protein TNCT_590031 [Trichonephila clavata]|uniref:Uncharacterized protein n=1 Tax=Trichonephila clavata TaxID=2740835 RepID=A0A8X6J0Z7_TRICU|nr:hypothetical protein TNCT_590031 [Trichonephila clavata]